MSVLQTGDRVSVLNDTIRGIVIRIEQHRVIIEDEDGFERSYPAKQLVFLSHDKAYKVSHDVVSTKAESEDPKKKSVPALKNPSFEIDLHIECLVDTHTGWTNHEILLRQMNVCKQFIQRALRDKQRRIVIIHGKGEGVLKSEVLSHLEKIRSYDGIRLSYHEADYAEYGIGGATEVVFY